jgi:hypothetical protein
MVCTTTVSIRGVFPVDGSARGEDFYLAIRGDFYLATRGDMNLATRGDFFMATDSRCPGMSLVVTCLLTRRCPAWRWRELGAGSGAERENLAPDTGPAVHLTPVVTRPARARPPSGRNHEGLSSDAGDRGGPPRSSDEGL